MEARSSFKDGWVLMSSGGVDFLTKQIFVRGISSLLYLVLLLVILASFVYNKARKVGDGKDGSKERFGARRIGSRYKWTLFFCYGLSIINLVFCLLSYFFWYDDSWFDGTLVTLFDLVVKTLCWGSLGVYLHTQFLNSSETKFPFALRIWWGFYLVLSCYCFVVDIVVHEKHFMFSQLQYLISDVVFVLSGLFFFYVGFLPIKYEVTLLGEPLLDDGSSLNGDLGSAKLQGSDGVTPYSTARLFSILTFSWIGRVIAVGKTKTLNLDDVPQLHSIDSVFNAFPVFKSKLESDTRLTMFKLVKAILYTAQKEIILTALFAALYTTASYVGPYLLDAFVQCLNGQGKYKNEGYILAATFFAAKIVECLSQRHWIFMLQQAGIRMQGVLVVMIYNKALTLSCQSKQNQTSGEIINIMTVDAERIGDFGWYMHDPWLVILQVGFAMVILYRSLGLASIAALFAMVLVMLTNFPLGRLQEKFQDKLMESKDKRMKATSEILRNMRILKLQAWEMKFLSKIFELRNTEVKWLKKFLYTTAVMSSIYWVAPTFVAVVAFTTCVLMGIPLESGKILSALATFRILQIPIYMLPDTVSMMIQTKVSLDRIASFLCLDDLPLDVVEKLPSGSSNTAVEIIDGNFSWDVSSTSPTLKDINLKVFHGTRVAVCGTVGSGKSSLLSCILGEIPKITGTLKLCGSKAYVAQSPWIQSGKIEENILFGKDMDRERYNRILEACSLNKDLEILSFGDQTIIGERGINLSGGQKQRIQIARALYQDSDIYLFDDPFSAVDAHTGSHLFKEVLLGLLNTRTVIYVTHQVEFLPAADLILVMKDGKITQAGKYDEILEAGSHFMELVGAHKEALLALDCKQSGSISERNSDDNLEKREGKEDLQNGKENEINGPKGQLVQDEEREKGRVGFAVYWKYIRTAYGGALVPFVLLAYVVFQVLQIGSSYWIAWATPVSKEVKPKVNESTLIILYIAMSAGSALSILVRNLLVTIAGYVTATILFDKMHLSIFRAPMSFFDSTPSGRILNRASTDQSTIDQQFSMQVVAVAFTMINLMGIIAVMSQIAWQVFLVFIPVIAVCIWYQQYYMPAARELSRLVGVCKAPVIQNFAETISGATTIRSFDQQLRFLERNMKLTDGYSRPKFHISGAMEWLCVRLDLFSCIVFAFSLVFLISFPGRINPAMAGLAVTYGLNLNMILAEMIWKTCRLENKIISVERILQYMSIPSEPPLVIEANKPDNTWPWQGEVVIDNLQVRYAVHLPLVLRGLTCTFPGGKKTGIVGRTGSGKSTLIQSLFRIVDPATGRILIDGMDISSIGLHDLRLRLGIIPQDPTMFEGTVRSNLDPLEEYSDDQIWEALDKCQLGDEVRRKEKKLDSSVTENGENWSMGQRQLVCLGRVLLKKSKILVLDEATASVDTATDNLIQKTLRQQFSDCTVITIAHRISSVIDSDIVVLLSHGLVEEYDSPARLLDDESSSFAKLVAEYTMRSSETTSRI